MLYTKHPWGGVKKSGTVQNNLDLFFKLNEKKQNKFNFS